MKKIFIYALFSFESLFILGIRYLGLLTSTVNLVGELETKSNIIVGVVWIIFIVTIILLIIEL